MVRWNASWSVAPQGGGSTSTPSTMVGYTYDTTQTLATLTHVFNDNVVNELRVGNTLLPGRPGADAAAQPELPRRARDAGRRSSLQGFNIGGIDQTLDRQMQNVYSVRNDLTFSFNKGGRHTLKSGRRVPAPDDHRSPVRALRGAARSDGRSDSGEHRSALSGPVRRHDVESGPAVADLAQVAPVDRRAEHLGDPAPHVGRLGAGRLDASPAPDAEPRAALRRRARMPLPTTW